MVRKAQTSFLLALVLTGLAACGGEAGGLFDTMEVANAAEAELFDTHGLRCDIGFNISNGRLASVNVVVDRAEISDLTIDDVTALIRPVVVRHFREEPDVLVLNVVLGK